MKKHKIKRGPAGAIKISAYVVYGEKQTRFDIDADTVKGGKMSLLGLGRLNRSRTVSAADVEFLTREFENLPVVDPLLPAGCGRFKVEILVTTEDSRKLKKSCLGVRTISEPAFRRYVNLLAISI